MLTENLDQTVLTTETGIDGNLDTPGVNEFALTSDMHTTSGAVYNTITTQDVGDWGQRLDPRMRKNSDQANRDRKKGRPQAERPKRAPQRKYERRQRQRRDERERHSGITMFLRNT